MTMVESFMSIAGACALASDESFMSFIEEDDRVISYSSSSVWVSTGLT